MSSFSQTFRISPAPSSAKVMTLPRSAPGATGPLPGHVLVGNLAADSASPPAETCSSGCAPARSAPPSVEIPAHQRQDQGLVPSLHVRVLPALKFAWLQPLSCLSGGSAMHSRSVNHILYFPAARAAPPAPRWPNGERPVNSATVDPIFLQSTAHYDIIFVHIQGQKCLLPRICGRSLYGGSHVQNFPIHPRL